MNMYRFKNALFVIAGFLGVAAWFFFSGKAPSHRIIESDHITHFIDASEDQLKAYASSLIVLDIDDTIYEAETLVGTPAWFYGMVKHLRRNGISRERAYEIIGDIDTQIQPLLRVRAIEPELTKAILDWQQRSIMVVALTSRPDYLSSVTQQQLNSLGISFRHPVFSCVDAKWNKEFGTLNQGVLHVNELTKSEVLGHFLDLLRQCDAKVTAIAHADDQEMYVHQIQDVAKKRDLSFVGLVYGRALRQRPFNMEQANRELKLFDDTKTFEVIPHDVRHLFSSI